MIYDLIKLHSRNQKGLTAGRLPGDYELVIYRQR